MKFKQRSFIIISAIILLFIALLLRNSYLQRTEQGALVTSIHGMDRNSYKIEVLDSITLCLQAAENDFRLYTTVWDTLYFKKYAREVRLAAHLLEDLYRNEEQSLSGEIKAGLAHKKGQLKLYSQIKRLTDSLTNVNTEVELMKIAPNVPEFKSYPNKVLKKTVKVEEVRKEPEVKKERFFRRLKNAIVNKEQAKDSVKTVHTEVTYEQKGTDASSSPQQEQEKIRAFYAKLFDNLKKNKKQLSSKEQAVLNLNEGIFKNIQRLFLEFRTRERAAADQEQEAIKNNAEHSLENIDKSRQVNFSLSILAYIAIILLLLQLYRSYDKTLKANLQVKEQVISKSRFFTSISHEMRTPLNAIIGVSEQLKSTPLNDDQRAMSKLLDNSSSMLLSAVNEVLDFSRLETGKLSLAKTPFKYKRVLRELRDTAKVLADQKKLILELSDEDAPDLLLYGDPYRLRQIVMNLIANAIKFTDKGKVSVAVNVKRNDTEQVILLISVTDTGIGIAAENLPTIFNEFSQVINSKRVDWQKGSGLGLPISKKLVELHKGNIHVESTLNKGTTFHIELPYAIAVKDTEDTVSERAPLLSSDRFKEIHLLVVDDSDMNLLVIKMIFKKLGISYDTANDGHEALRMLQGRDYDMVLTDIQMPVMDGLELTKQIRIMEDTKKANMPIIAITGQISSESHAIYMSSGMNDYIVKPFVESDLMEKILDYTG